MLTYLAVLSLSLQLPTSHCFVIPLYNYEEYDIAINFKVWFKHNTITSAYSFETESCEAVTPVWMAPSKEVEWVP
jgi:hypothetical protein